jgi:hypothetical protein
MSVFTAEDVINLGAGGNVAFNLMYLSRFQCIDYALPTGSDIGKLREFIKRKYIEKKWYTDESSRVSKAVPSSSSSAYCAQIDPRGLQKLGPIPTSIVKVFKHFFIQSPSNCLLTCKNSLAATGRSKQSR